MAAASAMCVTVPPGVLCQDEAGLLWDVLTMLRWTVRRQSSAAVEEPFGVHFRNHNRERTPPVVRVKAISDPNEQGEPAPSRMRPEGD